MPMMVIDNENVVTVYTNDIYSCRVINKFVLHCFSLLFPLVSILCALLFFNSLGSLSLLKVVLWKWSQVSGWSIRWILPQNICILKHLFWSYMFPLSLLSSMCLLADVRRFPVLTIVVFEGLQTFDGNTMSIIQTFVTAEIQLVSLAWNI